ncbi:hypothetical protein AYI69_g1509 [Smittium culicis]|uniref:Uncharacterized protein n=1 Tax=Smittium culicis TaxID=133412 RepID=A0A1R1YQ19_9FUNG|nr:hypothetical protein AYI69_g1509 [Smittium culicis]
MSSLKRKEEHEPAAITIDPQTENTPKKIKPFHYQHYLASSDSDENIPQNDLYNNKNNNNLSHAIAENSSSDFDPSEFIIPEDSQTDFVAWSESSDNYSVSYKKSKKSIPKTPTTPKSISQKPNQKNPIIQVTFPLPKNPTFSSTPVSINADPNTNSPTLNSHTNPNQFLSNSDSNLISESNNFSSPSASSDQSNDSDELFANDFKFKIPKIRKKSASTAKPPKGTNKLNKNLNNFAPNNFSHFLKKKNSHFPQDSDSTSSGEEPSLPKFYKNSRKPKKNRQSPKKKPKLNIDKLRISRFLNDDYTKNNSVFNYSFSLLPYFKQISEIRNIETLKPTENLYGKNQNFTIEKLGTALNVLESRIKKHGSFIDAFKIKSSEKPVKRKVFTNWPPEDILKNSGLESNYFAKFEGSSIRSNLLLDTYGGDDNDPRLLKADKLVHTYAKKPIATKKNTLNSVTPDLPQESSSPFPSSDSDNESLPDEPPPIIKPLNPAKLKKTINYKEISKKSNYRYNIIKDNLIRQWDDLDNIDYDSDIVKYGSNLSDIDTESEHESKPATESADKPITEPATDSSTEPTIEPIIEHINEPIIEHINEPIIEHINEPIIEHINEPITEHIIEPIIVTTSESPIEHSIEPEAENETIPVIESDIEIKLEPGIEPVIEFGLDSESNVKPEPQSETEFLQKCELFPPSSQNISTDSTVLQNQSDLTIISGPSSSNKKTQNLQPENYQDFLDDFGSDTPRIDLYQSLCNMYYRFIKENKKNPPTEILKRNSTGGLSSSENCSESDELENDSMSDFIVSDEDLPEYPRLENKKVYSHLELDSESDSDRNENESENAFINSISIPSHKNEISGPSLLNQISDPPLENAYEIVHSDPPLENASEFAPTDPSQQNLPSVPPSISKLLLSISKNNSLKESEKNKSRCIKHVISRDSIFNRKELDSELADVLNYHNSNSFFKNRFILNPYKRNLTSAAKSKKNLMPIKSTYLFPYNTKDYKPTKRKYASSTENGTAGTGSGSGTGNDLEGDDSLNARIQHYLKHRKLYKHVILTRNAKILHAQHRYESWDPKKKKRQIYSPLYSSPSVRSEMVKTIQELNLLKNGELGKSLRGRRAFGDGAAGTSSAAGCAPLDGRTSLMDLTNTAAAAAAIGTGTSTGTSQKRSASSTSADKQQDQQSAARTSRRALKPVVAEVIASETLTKIDAVVSQLKQVKTGPTDYRYGFSKKFRGTIDWVDVVQACASIGIPDEILARTFERLVALFDTQ